MESGLGFPRRQEGGCVSPGDAVRDRATSSHGMVREGSHIHTLGTGGEGSPLSIDTRVKTVTTWFSVTKSEWP